MADRSFYGAMGVILFSLVILGFGTAALVRGQNPFGLPLLFHIHAITYLAWFGFFIFQASLIGKGNRSLHMTLGRLSPLIVAAMLVTGWLMASSSYSRGVSPIPGITVQQFMAFPFFDLLGLLVFYGLAYLKRLDAAFHKRAMLLALIAILDPATARLGMTLGIPPFPVLVSLILVTLIMWHDRKTLSKVQLITWFGFTWIFLRLGFVFGFAASDVWAKVTTVLFEGAP